MHHGDRLLAGADDPLVAPLGHLTRRYGLTIDHLLAVDVVLADGGFVTATAEEHPDLFWALRGGGGNFGAVTSFRFRCHPVSTVIAGPVFYDLTDAGEVLRWYRDFLPAAPEDLNGLFLFGAVPPAPPFPDHLQARKVCGVMWMYTGPPGSADEVLAPVREFGSPLMDGLHEAPYPAVQSAFDALYPPDCSGTGVPTSSRRSATTPSPCTRSSPKCPPCLDDAPVSHRRRRPPGGRRRRDRLRLPRRHLAGVMVGVDPDRANIDSFRVTEVTAIACHFTHTDRRDGRIVARTAREVAR
jgi:hypothetical protein